MNRNIRNAGIFGIIYALFIIPLMITETVREITVLSKGLVIFYIIFYIISGILYMLFVYGFVLIGKKLKLPLLVNISYLQIILSIIYFAFVISDIAFPILESPRYNSIAIFILGMVNTLYGVGILGLKKKFGAIAAWTGVLNMILGISSSVTFLFFISFLLVIPTVVLEIIILFKASKKL